MVLRRDGSGGMEIRAHDMGQGVRTAPAQIAADALGLDIVCSHRRDPVTEKLATGLHEGWRLMTGGSAQSVLKGYRKKVQANARRLSR